MSENSLESGEQAAKGMDSMKDLGNLDENGMFTNLPIFSFIF